MASGSNAGQTEHHEIVIIGAGFGGLYAIHKLRSAGHDVLCLESAKDVGGVWYHNRYPGARCDVRSIDYSYSFSADLYNEWTWSEKYAAQPEILKYINYVADRFDLRSSIRCGVRVVGSRFSEGENLWYVTTSTGEILTARFVIVATGNLSTPKDPEFPGLADFKGQWFQTAVWPKEEVRFEGKRVGVIGTGSSGVQAIPIIARTAGHLYVFQRTPVFSAPAQNGPMDMEELGQVRSRFSDYVAENYETPAAMPRITTGKVLAEFDRDDALAQLDRSWALGGTMVVSIFTDTLADEATNAVVSEYARDRIRLVVKDPKVAEMLCPHDHPIGSRRMCIDTGYYETYNRPNVTLVDVRAAPIERITATGIQTATDHYELDIIVFAIGFDAFTGPIQGIDPVNARGEHMADRWRDGAQSYLGLVAAGFPNMFLVNGPGSPSVLANMVRATEQHVDWISRCIDWMNAQGYQRIEANADAEEAWADEVAEKANATLYVKANSWYMGSNVEGKPRKFIAYAGGFGNYTKRCNDVAANGYEGFTLS
jgi:cation diffusion facilitator CzcD-associated flavoprotein CzcO